MRKMQRAIKLMKLKSKINEDVIKKLEGTEFIVCFQDGKDIVGCDTYDLMKILKKDYIKPISYIFDMTDGIIIKRDELIDTDEV